MQTCMCFSKCAVALGVGGFGTDTACVASDDMSARNPLTVLFCIVVGTGFWALHVATGFFDRLIQGPGSRRSLVLGKLDEWTQSWLVAPFGVSGAIIVIVCLGTLLASLVWLMKARLVKKPDEARCHD